ncbi:MAG: hypothetical protein CL583_07695 [Alteromonadaceae bacterium]|nr:hypothetical protein [Alteromonadaceae bacterium]
MGLGNRLYWVLGLALILGVSGCSNDADPDEPVVLGTPPETAYLGVEYAYNFGAYGGDDILDFTLVNAPSWLSFEDTTNKARSGVILRGVPGITGGRNGEDDLGSYNNISVNVTDGSRLGGNVFDITVEHNPLAVEDATFTEGESKLPPAAADVLERAGESDFDPAEDSVCLPPDVETQGTISASVPQYDNSGNLVTQSQTYKTWPVLVPITLGHPSVEPVTVAFRLSSAYRDPCKNAAGDEVTGDACTYAQANQEIARLDWDFVASSGSLETPEYLTYNADDSGVGTVTFEPGKTTCFIRLEVIDDQLPELSEAFRLDLVEVRDGLASFNAAESDSTAALVIEDDEPFVTFEPETLVVSEGSSRTITARLNKVNDTGAPLKVKVIHDPLASSADDADFSLAFAGQPDDSVKSVTVEIPAGQREATFTVKALNNAYVAPADPKTAVPGENLADHVDDTLILKSDVTAQFGRSNYAGSATASTEVTINEWVQTTTFNAGSGFSPTALAVGDYGELYVAGNQDGIEVDGVLIDEQVAIYYLDRLGRFNADSDVPPDRTPIYVNPGDVNARVSGPRLAYSSQTTQGENEALLVRSLTLGYTVDSGELYPNAGKGGRDVGISLVRNQGKGNGFEPLWEAQLGSTSDDILVDIAFNASVGILFSAQTEAAWGLSEEPYRGGTDFVLGQVDSVAVQGNNTQRHDFKWAKLFGTSADDTLKATPVSPNGTLYPTGQTLGAFDTGSPQHGATDLFFIDTSVNNILGETYQLGTSAPDTVADAAFIGNNVWAGGSSTVPYKVLADGTLDPAITPVGNSRAYVMVVSGNEGAISAISLSGAAGTSDHNITSIAGLNDYAVIGGSTETGPFVADVQSVYPAAILASVSLKEQEPVVPGDEEEDEEEEDRVRQMQENWRYQLPTSTAVTRVIDVAVTGNGKIFALIEEGDDSGYSVILLDETGVRLDR